MCSKHCTSCTKNGADKCDPDGCDTNRGFVYNETLQNCVCKFLPDNIFMALVVVVWTKQLVAILHMGFCI